MVISDNLKLKGDLKFERLLHVNGHFEGKISAPENVIAQLST